MMAMGLGIASYFWYLAGGFYLSAEISSNPISIKRYMRCGYWSTELAKFGVQLFVLGVCLWLWKVAP